MEPSELERAANYLTEKLQAATEASELRTVREAILRDMRADQSALHDLLQKALVLAEQTFSATPLEEKVVVEGEQSFLDAPEFANVREGPGAPARLRREGPHPARARPRAHRAGGPIFIGAESEFAAVPDVSVVAAPYGRGDHVLGTLAVVGPTRMKPTPA